MNPLLIQPTPSSPAVHFEPTARTLTIAGESYPENSFAFYAPILDWAREYLAEGEALQVELRLVYMNSSSTKCVLDLFELLEGAYQRGKAVAVAWHYDPDNPRALELAEEFREEVTFPFRTVASPE